MADIRVSTEAADDMKVIQKYISQELNNKQAAKNTSKKISRKIKILYDFPMAGSSLQTIIDIPNEYRYLICGKYIIFYRFVDEIIYIDRVMYGGRDFIKMLFELNPHNE